VPDHIDNPLLYLEFPDVLEFDTSIDQVTLLPDGRIGAILTPSYFYPTGGGQEHDSGAIGEAQVLDVFIDEGLGLIHVIDRQINVGPSHAQIDQKRRLRHMQHHTAQHLLTQCFLRLFDYETISANINGYSPSTLDLSISNIPKKHLDQAEDLANKLVYEDRLVKSYFVTADELRLLPLRRPPKVVKNIRIVEIDSFDYSACGGTHCARTGMIGVVKILKSERLSDKIRVHFVAGLQALYFFGEYQNCVLSLAGLLSVHSTDILDAVQRQINQVKENQRELEALRFEKIVSEANHLIENEEITGGYHIILAAYENRPVAELRLLADELKKKSDAIAVLSTYNGQKISMVILCSDGVRLNARELLQKLLSQIDGKGGGDGRMAQGGGTATREQIEALLNYRRETIVQSL
jgi:alanyl-tRNA synthetase